MNDTRIECIVIFGVKGRGGHWLYEITVKSCKF